MRIVFFGDSLTQGTMGVSFVDKVAAALPAHQFINAGVNGDTSLNLYRRVDHAVIDHKPDGVFILIGVNDAISAAEPGSRAYYRFFKGIPQGQISPIFFRENLRAVVARLLHNGAQVWVGLPPVEYRPEVVDTLRKVNAYASEVCAELKVPTLDLFSAMLPESIPPRVPIGVKQHVDNLRMMLLRGAPYDRLRDRGGFTYSFDGIHLTENGAARIADLVVSFLRKQGVS